MTSIYIARHGETASNVDKRMQGSLPVPLNARGTEQATRLANWLNDNATLTEVYSSPATRAQQTAQIVANRLGIPLKLAPPLAEIDCGAWQGKKLKELRREHPEAFARFWQGDEHFCFPGGESLHMAGRRIASLFDELVMRLEGDVLLVSHGAVITVLLAHVFKRDLTEVWQNASYLHKNTALTILESDITKSGLVAFEAVSLAVTPHLGI